MTRGYPLRSDFNARGERLGFQQKTGKFGMDPNLSPESATPALLHPKIVFSARLHPVTPLAHAPARSAESAVNPGAFPNAFGRRGSGMVRGRRTPATDETNLFVSIRVPSWFPPVAFVQTRLHPRPSVSIRGCPSRSLVEAHSGQRNFEQQDPEVRGGFIRAIRDPR